MHFKVNLKIFNSEKISFCGILDFGIEDNENA